MPNRMVFINRMPANDTDNTVAYGIDNVVVHQLDRTPDGDKNGYPDQISVERPYKDVPLDKKN